MKEKKKIQNMKKEELAKWLHDNYEEISREVGWNTQKSCKVEFEDLPRENKLVMIKIAGRIFKRIR